MRAKLRRVLVAYSNYVGGKFAQPQPQHDLNLGQRSGLCARHELFGCVFAAALRQRNRRVRAVPSAHDGAQVPHA